MRELFRLTSIQFAADLRGTGARLAGGRWNPRGLAVVYTSTTRALAVVEYLVHVSLHRLPSPVRLVRLLVPENLDVESVESASLPANWADTPPPPALADLGGDWVGSRRSLLLQVPSAVVQQEHNVLINPEHPEIDRLTVSPPEPFDVDSRFLP